jgi:hypothetical protein
VAVRAEVDASVAELLTMLAGPDRHEGPDGGNGSGAARLDPALVRQRWKAAVEGLPHFKVRDPPAAS